MNRASLLIGWSLTTISLAADPPSPPSTSATELDGIRFYESRIRPVLADRCYQCHSAKAEKLKGALKLDDRSAVVKGGASGPAAIPGDADKSLLIRAIRRNHADVAAMPPDRPLTAEQIRDLVDWVNRGLSMPMPSPISVSSADPASDSSIAEARRQFPYSPIPGRVPIPVVDDTSVGRDSIDRFIAAKRTAAGLSAVGPADQYTWIRRVTYDLIGLPPTAREVDEYLADRSPAANDRVVDRLLASPHYGERWGRHWLDIVRYADTAGDNSDFPIPQMYRYRNWVIDAINRDLPYDQFVKEQLAGDLMKAADEDERIRRVIATGYIANARRFGSRVDDYPQHLTIEDTIDNLGRAFLGLSLTCARCHDHKFDPISMADYYGLYGFFHSTRYPWPGIELEQRQRDLVPLASQETVRQATAERERRLAEFNNRMKELEKRKSKAEEKSRTSIQKEIDAVRDEQRRFQGSPLPYETLYAVAEGKKIESVRIHLKGDPERLGSLIPRRFPMLLGGQRLPDSDTTSGRLALAEWIASPDNPLFARVIVNRVWHYLFGRGLVPTPNDFGKQGASVTHPELLDYLARTFIADDRWSLKRLHRRIVLSDTYGLASTGEAPGMDRVDPNNELLSVFRRRRLDAESIRDTLAVVGDSLNRSPGGPHPFPESSTWKFTQHNPFRAVYETDRRSVYLMTQRIQRHPFLAVFDGADTAASTGSRVTSTTALQSLYFLNDSFVHQQAVRTAAIVGGADVPDAEFVTHAYRRLFARLPDDAERSAGVSFLNVPADESGGRQRRVSYILALFRLNEFVYVD